MLRRWQTWKEFWSTYYGYFHIFTVAILWAVMFLLEQFEGIFLAVADNLVAARTCGSRVQDILSVLLVCYTSCLPKQRDYNIRGSPG